MIKNKINKLSAKPTKKLKTKVKDVVIHQTKTSSNTKNDNNDAINNHIKKASIIEQKKEPIIETKAAIETKEKVNQNNYDYLLGSLEIIADILESKISANALIANLPINDKLSIDLLGRAASRAGLITKSYNLDLENIEQYLLPCILILKNNKACILCEYDNSSQTYQVIFPETGKAKSTINFVKLNEIYAGKCIFVRKQYKYDYRSTNIAIDKPHSWFWGTIKKAKSIYLTVGLASVFINIFMIASSIFVLNVYDRVVPNGATETLWFMVMGVMLAYVFDFILKNIRVYLLDTAGKKADIMLSSRIFETILSIKMSHKPLSSGSFANEVREFDSIRDFFSSITLATLVDIPFVFLFITIIYFIGGPSLAYVPMFSMVLILLGACLMQNKLKILTQRRFRESAQKNSILIEVISSLETIKSFSVEGRKLKEWEESIAQSAESGNKLKFKSSFILNYASFIQQSAYIFLIVSGVYLIMEGELTMGALIATSILSSRSLVPIMKIVGLITKFNHIKIALSTLDRIINLPTEYPINKTFVKNTKFKGNIEFKKVNFAYSQPNLQDDNVEESSVSILNDCSFTIKAGEHVGILGKIGSGKTTIEKLILNLYDPVNGSVTIDNLDVNQINPTDLRNQIGYIAQDIYLFFGSVRENITFGRHDINDQELINAAQISGVYDFVQAHPRGFDMQVGEGGCLLSGGQKQAVAIARAIVRKPNIFIMDEPTSMMDEQSEGRVVQALARYTINKTLILISHKRHLLQLVDRLMVVQNGTIVIDGNKEFVINQLIEKK